MNYSRDRSPIGGLAYGILVKLTNSTLAAVSLALPTILPHGKVTFGDEESPVGNMQSIFWRSGNIKGRRNTVTVYRPDLVGTGYDVTRWVYQRKKVVSYFSYLQLSCSVGDGGQICWSREERRRQNAAFIFRRTCEGGQTFTARWIFRFVLTWEQDVTAKLSRNTRVQYFIMFNVQFSRVSQYPWYPGSSLVFVWDCSWNVHVKIALRFGYLFCPRSICRLSQDCVGYF